MAEDYQLGANGRVALVVGGIMVVVVVAILVACAVISPCLLNRFLRREEERRRQTRSEKRPLVHPPPPPTLKLSTPNSKRPSDPFIPPHGEGGHSPTHSPLSPTHRLDGTLLGALAAKRDSTYSSMSEQSLSPLQSGRNSLCESTGYASLVTSPTVDCASPLPHASGQLSITLHYSSMTPASSPTGGGGGGDSCIPTEATSAVGKLTVNVLEARGLTHPHMPPTTPPHVYVRVMVWREKKGLRKVKTSHINVFRTRTIRHCSEPVFNESFVADLGRIDPKEIVVRLVVESQDRWVCPTVLGECTIALRMLPPESLNEAPPKLSRQILNLSSQSREQQGEEAADDNEDDLRLSVTPLTYCLSPPAQDLGNILISASYLPTAQRLSICIIKASDLRYNVAADSLSEFYPYVRVLLLNKGRLLKKKKTGYCTNTASPQWNQSLIYSLQPQQIESASVVVCVCTRPQVPPTSANPSNNNNNVAPKGSSSIYNPFNNNNNDNKNIIPFSKNKKNSFSNSSSKGSTKTLSGDDYTDHGSDGGGGGDCKPDQGGRKSERYVGKVVIGSHVRIATAKEFYRSIIQTPRTQHTQWHALR